jgi:hypothetical protein
VSLIRKPSAAERESSVRRVAEDAIASGRVLRNAGRNAGQRAGRGAGKIATFWLLTMFTFGALTASSFGAKLLGLIIMAPFWYFAWRSWSADRH